MREFERNREAKKFVRGDSGRSDRSNRRFSRGNSRRDSGRRRGSDRQERTEVTCDSCKKRCEVPFKPTSNKPVYCSDCFKKDLGSKSDGLKEINRKLDKIMKVLEID